MRLPVVASLVPELLQRLQTILEAYSLRAAQTQTGIIDPELLFSRWDNDGLR